MVGIQMIAHPPKTYHPTVTHQVDMSILFIGRSLIILQRGFSGKKLAKVIN
jgi:hypothetical protein